MGIAELEKGRTFASAFGNNGTAAQGPSSDNALRMAAGRDDPRGSSESPVGPEGRQTESREAGRKKNFADRLQDKIKCLPLQPATPRGWGEQERFFEEMQNKKTDRKSTIGITTVEDFDPMG